MTLSYLTTHITTIICVNVYKSEIIHILSIFIPCKMLYNSEKIVFMAINCIWKLDLKQFYRVGKTFSLICRLRESVVPKQIQNSLVGWYHKTLCHFDKTKIKLTIGQHFYWKGLQKSIHNVCSKWQTASRNPSMEHADALI